MEELNEKLIETKEAPEGEIANWYVIHTRTGYEAKVKSNLEQRLNNESEEIRSRILEVKIPTKQCVEVHSGKKKIVEKKVWASYVYVKMVMTSETWYIVRNTPGVTGFCGMGSHPTPLLPEEAAMLEENAEEIRKIEVNFKVGDEVIITAGALNNTTGTVSTITDHSVTILVEAFGTRTPVTLGLDEVKKKK